MSSNALLWPSQGTIPEERLDKYKWLRLPSQGVGGIIAGPQMQYEDLDIMAYEVDWLDVRFLQRIPLTINGGQVPSTQIDFPLLINDIYPDLIGEVEAELRFAGSNNIQLDYEIQEFDNSTGLLIAWVKKPTVDNGDKIFIYFDNPTAVDEQDSFAVWNDYNAVYHMNQTTFGVDSILDSTINDNKGSTVGSPTSVAGKIGDAYRTNATGIVTIDDSVSIDIGVGSFTIEMWEETFGAGNTGFGLIQKKIKANSADPGFLWGNNFAAEDTGLQMRLNDSTHTNDELFNFTGSRTILQNTGLHHIVITYDSGTKIVTQYIDGDPFASGTYGQSGDFSSTEPLTFGAMFLPDDTFDEIRLSVIVKTADYVTTSFNNQDAPGTFYSTGAVENVPPLIDMMEYEE